MKRIILKKLSNNRLELVPKYRLSGNDILVDKLEIDLLDRYPSISTMNEESLNEFYLSLEEFYGRISKYVQYSIDNGDEESVTTLDKSIDAKDIQGEVDELKVEIDNKSEGKNSTDKEDVSDIQVSGEEVDTNAKTTHKHRTSKKTKL
jgi:hypothetical protein